MGDCFIVYNISFYRISMLLLKIHKSLNGCIWGVSTYVSRPLVLSQSWRRMNEWNAEQEQETFYGTRALPTSMFRVPNVDV